MLNRRDELGQRSETVRRANLSVILRELHTRGALSRSELVARTGLTRSAIRGLIGELAASGLVSETRAAPLGTPGRPSPLVSPEPDGATVLALDIEVDSIAAAIVGLGGEVIDEIRVDRPRRHSSVGAGRRPTSASWPRPSSADDPSPDTRIGIGVAVVGVVRRSDGVVSMAPNLGWVDVGLRDELVRMFGDDVPIHVANEADLGALAEARRGAAVGADHILYLSGEVGVGGGIIVDGEPFIGAAGLWRRGRPHAGQPGRPGVSLRLDRLLGDGGRLAEPPAAGGPGRDRRPGRGRRAPARRPKRAPPSPWAPSRRPGAGSGSAWPASSTSSIRGSSCFGGLFGRIHPFVARIVEAELDRRALAAPRRLVRIVPAKLGVEAPLRGAAELAFEPLLADPARWMRPRGVDRAIRRSGAQEGGSLAPTFGPL